MSMKHLLRQTSLERRNKHYSNSHQIFLFGGGDFSFSSALAKAFGSAKNMVSSPLDRRDKTLDKSDGFRIHRDNALKENGNIAKQSALALRLKECVSIVELESERKARIDAESARDEMKRQKDEALLEKAKVARQLAEALRLKEDAINQRDLSMLNHKLERQARKAAEKAAESVKEQARKAAETEHEYLKDLHNREKKAKMNKLLSRKENACREKEKIAKQLDEVLRLEAEKINNLQRQRDDALSQKENAFREKKRL